MLQDRENVILPNIADTYLLQTIGLSLLIESYLLLNMIDQFDCYLEVFENIDKMEFCAIYFVYLENFNNLKDAKN